MEVIAVVLHKGALAHYTVSRGNGESYTAHLIRYGGDVRNKPPRHLHFIEEGRHCSGDTNNQELMDDLCYTAKLEMNGNNAPWQDGPIRG
jgi:hypothetical protein